MAPGFQPTSRPTAGWFFNCSISVIAGDSGIIFAPVRLQSRPVEYSLFPDVEEANQKDSDIYQHLPQPKALQIAQNDGPRIDEYRFNVEQNEQHSDQVEFHGEALPGVSDRGHAAFIR